MYFVIFDKITAKITLTNKKISESLLAHQDKKFNPGFISGMVSVCLNSEEMPDLRFEKEQKNNILSPLTHGIGLVCPSKV